jgi:SSS family solute:Na+ symporter
MSGSGYVMGMAIASYEWMAALTLIVVGKWILPVFLKNGIYTMPEFLERRYSPAVRNVMAVFWLALYIFVNLTSILWLGALAVNAIAGLDIQVAITCLALFALAYALYGGLKAVALTDIVQVSLLVLGGIIITYMSLDKVSGGAGVIAGFKALTTQFPEKFDMILSKDSPHYKDLPGLAVLLGGMWMMNVSYWGFNQYIIQRGLAAKSVNEAQKGIVLAAFLKLLMPAIIVVPGIAALVLVPGLEKTTRPIPSLMAMLPGGHQGPGVRGAGRGDRRVDRIERSIRSRPSSRWTCTAPRGPIPSRRSSWYHRAASSRACPSSSRSSSRRAVLRNFGQGFQYIQNFTGLRHAGHLRDLPAGPVLGAHHGDGGDGFDARHGCYFLGVLQIPAGLPVHEPRGLVLRGGHRDRSGDLADVAYERSRDARRYHECRLQDWHVLQCRGRADRRDSRGALLHLVVAG